MKDTLRLNHLHKKTRSYSMTIGIKSILASCACIGWDHLLSLKFRLNPTSPNTYYFIHSPKNTCPKGTKTIQLVIKLTCAQNPKEARAHAQIKNERKVHMRQMHDCVRKKPCTPENGEFMVLVGPSPTSGSDPKSI